MAQPVRNITIVGGGTAGWLAALLLSASFSRHDGRPDGRKITLIESPNIPTVGVGEATVPGMPRLLQQCQVSEREFFRATNASFKLGVMFAGWNVTEKGTPIDYINPFSEGSLLDGINTGAHFHRFGAGKLNYVQTIAPTWDLGLANKGPRMLGMKEYDRTLGFAYHLDAGLFAKLMKEVATGRGVTHILDDMQEVELDDRGYVAALKLKETGRHPVELVIDCTGFRGLIINEALGEPFVDYSRFLANDRAMAVQIAHPDDKLQPLTRSTALGAGWSWRVPLYNRIGTGYVFSSAHRSDDEARDEFVRHLGPENAKAEPRVIPMRIGRTRNSWVKNCVAIGLSAGFIEPLESTAIHMTEMAVRWLLTYYPDSDFSEPVRARYNKVANRLYDEVRDFICIHYALGNRTDSPYWIDARTELEVPDSLAENLELWKRALPSHYDVGQYQLFSPQTYQAVLLGKQVYRTGWGEREIPFGSAMSESRWKQFLAGGRKQINNVVAKAADHRTLIAELRGELKQEPAAFAPLAAGAGTVPMPGQGAPVTGRFVPPTSPEFVASRDGEDNLL